MSEVIFGIYQTVDSIIIHNINCSKLISIDKDYLSINSKDISYLNTINKTGEYRARGILGILNIGMMDFLLYITSSIKIGSIGNKDIYEIKDINFLGISNNIKISDEIIAILNEIRSVVQQGFYYSHHFDLTNSLQNQKLIKIKNNYNYDVIQDADKKFLWNYELNSKFYDHCVDSDFMINCICGYIGVIPENSDSFMNYILISRRSCLNAGVKLMKRGLDMDGNAANFVETEQIVIAGENIFSFVQVRGGPPLIFNDETINDFILDNSNSNRTKNNTNISFEKHINDLLGNSYKLALIINLMNVTKKNEQLATTVMEELIRQNEYKYLKYLFFDYFNETNNSKSNTINMQSNSDRTLINTDSDGLNSFDNFLQKIENVLNIFKFFGIFKKRNLDCEENERKNCNMSTNYKTTKTSTDQVGIIRTCCYDGLERTNLIQKRIAMKILLSQLNEMGADTSSLFGENLNHKADWSNGSIRSNQELKIETNTIPTQIKSIGKNQSENQFSLFENESEETIANSVDKLNLGINVNQGVIRRKSESNSFIDSFNKIWAENGVKLSIQYTGGVGIASTDVNQEYILKQNFKQRCIDIFLQKFEPSFMKKNSAIIEKELENFVDKYKKNEELKIFVGTWNVAGQTFNKDLSLLEFLFPPSLNKSAPDIYFIGLQEIVKLSANYVLISSNQPKVDQWKNILKYNLDKINSYTLIKCLDLVGVALFCYVKTPLKDKIKNIDTLIIKTGMMGTMGNKGSCLLRFEYGDTSIAVSSGHLAAGKSSKNSRINELSDILIKSFPYYREKSFREHDVMLIFGDLNFRIDLEYLTCLQIIKNKNVNYLVEYDQLNKIRNVNLNFFDLEEGALTFNPTYKFVIGSTEYDGKKKRVPSWCDRVIYKPCNKLTLIDYYSADITLSDHRPVYSIFSLSVIEESKEEKLKIINEIKQRINLEINPQVGCSRKVSGFIDFDKENNQKYFEKNFSSNEKKRGGSFDYNKKLKDDELSSGEFLLNDFDDRGEKGILNFFK